MTAMVYEGRRPLFLPAKGEARSAAHKESLQDASGGRLPLCRARCTGCPAPSRNQCSHKSPCCVLRASWRMAAAWITLQLAAPQGLSLQLADPALLAELLSAQNRPDRPNTSLGSAHLQLGRSFRLSNKALIAQQACRALWRCSRRGPGPAPPGSSSGQPQQQRAARRSAQ